MTQLQDQLNELTFSGRKPERRHNELLVAFQLLSETTGLVVFKTFTGDPTRQTVRVINIELPTNSTSWRITAENETVLPALPYVSRNGMVHENQPSYLRPNPAHIIWSPAMLDRRYSK